MLTGTYSDSGVGGEDCSHDGYAVNGQRRRRPRTAALTPSRTQQGSQAQATLPKVHRDPTPKTSISHSSIVDEIETHHSPVPYKDTAANSPNDSAHRPDTVHLPSVIQRQAHDLHVILDAVMVHGLKVNTHLRTIGDYQQMSSDPKHGTHTPIRQATETAICSVELARLCLTSVKYLDHCTSTSTMGSLCEVTDVRWRVRSLWPSVRTTCRGTFRFGIAGRGF